MPSLPALLRSLGLSLFALVLAGLAPQAGAQEFDLVLRGGRVMADWPGLAAQNLYQGRDLQPTLDARRILKAVLRDHLGLDGRAIDRAVLPGSDGAAPLDGLFRA